VPLIYGDDTSPAHPVSRLTWVALVSDVVLVAYWVFMNWVFGLPPNTPGWSNASSSYSVLGSFAVAFAAAVITSILAIVGLVRARTPGTRTNVPGILALVAACALNPVIGVPLLLGTYGS
jgi:hypothetical protein